MSIPYPLTNRAAMLLLLLGVAAFIGCGQERLPGLVPASGIVTYQGDPIADAWVTFVPSQPGSSQRAASSVTDGQGHFTMTTLDPQDGVVPGEYFVKISKKVDSTDNSKADIDAGRAKPKNNTRHIQYVIPQKYEQPEESGLVVQIESQGNQAIEFHLD